MSETIKYLSGGFLGDFVYQLSVIKEKFLETGMKGEVFLTNDECWKFGINKAFTDLKEIIEFQDYIADFKIYNNEQFGNFISLSSWRDNDLLFKTDFKELFKNEYNIEFGTHKWLDLPTNQMFNETILISSTELRCNPYFNYESLNLCNRQIFFATTDISEYDHFSKTTNGKFNMIFFNNLKDFWIAINSCELFVCSFGSFLCVANALYKNTIALLTHAHTDILLPKDLVNLKWFKNDYEHNL